MQSSQVGGSRRRSREDGSRGAGSSRESSKNGSKQRKKSSSSPPPPTTTTTTDDHDRRRSLHKKKRRHSSSSSSTSSRSSSDSESRKRILRKKKKAAKAERKERKRLCKAKKKKKKQSRNEVHLKPSSTSTSPVQAELADSKEMIGPDPKMMQRNSMKPMSKEEWDKKQSVLRHVYDPESGRTRLIKGDGEVMEEIVTYEQHLEINKKATEGDGATFQAKMGLQKKALFDRSKSTTSKGKKA